MPAELDVHGQPEPRFNAARRADRAIHEMLGLVKGVIVDGIVSDSEAQYLAHWINANPDAVAFWPGRALADRLIQIFADGHVDEDEREDLRYFLQQLVGEDHGQHGDVNPATRLPLDEPAPPLEFRDREYVFTGRLSGELAPRAMPRLRREEAPSLRISPNELEFSSWAIWEVATGRTHHSVGKFKRPWDIAKRASR